MNWRRTFTGIPKQCVTFSSSLLLTSSCIYWNVSRSTLRGHYNGLTCVFCSAHITTPATLLVLWIIQYFSTNSFTHTYNIHICIHIYMYMPINALVKFWLAWPRLYTHAQNIRSSFSLSFALSFLWLFVVSSAYCLPFLFVRLL